MNLLCLQIAQLFNASDVQLRHRYVNSDVLNITESEGGMRVGILMYFSADYFNLINQSEIISVMNQSLIR